MKTTANGMTAAQVNTGNEIVNATAAAYLRGTEPVKEESTGRECYAFGLYVGGELTRFVTANCWMHQKEAKDYALGMALAARAFRNTASIGIYKLENNDVWQLMETICRHSTNERTVFKIHTSRVKGCDFVKPTQEEERAFIALADFHRLPFQDVAALPIGWNDPAPFFVAGMRYRCTRDVVMKSKGHPKAFKAGNIYEQTADPSPFYGWLTNEQGNRHAWAQPAELAEHCKTWNSKPEDNDPRQYFEAVA